MAALVGILGALVICVILWDAFETIVLPRRVTRRVRLTRFVVAYAWAVWSALVRRIPARRPRETYLSFFGPLVVLVLLMVWAAGLIVGFGMLQWRLGSRVRDPGRLAGMGTDLYFSGTTFFTLGLGDVAPNSPAARGLVVAESGLGFGFLAMVISYLPVLYQAFSRREVRISMLDAWAGSPPAAGELVRRLGADACALLGPFLQEWERWSAELLESHISYPVLAYFRSQHDNQSWLAALTAVLDVCALAIACVEGAPVRLAELTFAMARHAVVDLCQVLSAPPRALGTDRLSRDALAGLEELLRAAGVPLRADAAALGRLAELRAMYEPYVNALSQRLLVDLPPWTAAAGARDNWQRTAWR